MAGANNVGTIEYDARINTKQLQSDARTAEKIASDTGGNIAKHGGRSFSAFADSASGAFGSVADSIAGLAKVATGLFIGGAFGVGTFVKAASELQGMRASFEAMTGSAENASAVLRSLNKFSFETAFSAASINKAAQLLLGAGENVDRLGKSLKDIGDIAGATGADLGMLTLPISQALARGKLQTQDYYQILNSGAGKLGQVLRDEVANRGLGNIQDAMSEGTVTAEILFETMSKAASEGGFAFQGAIKQARTFDGQMSNLQETILNVGMEILGVDKASGEVKADGVFAKISTAVQDATKWLNDNKETIKGIATVVIDNFIPALGAIAGAFVAAKVAAVIFSIAAAPALAIPTLIAGAITALIGAMVFLEMKFGTFSGAVNRVVQAVSPFITQVMDVLLPVLRDLWNTVSQALQPAFDGIVQSFQNIMDKLAPLMPFLELFAKIMGVVVFGAIVVVIGIIAGLVTTLTYALNTVMYFVEKGVDYFMWFWNSLNDGFQMVGEIIYNAVVGNFKGAINSVLGWAVKQINYFIRMINGVVDVINAIPNVHVSKIGELSVPALAEGGVVSKATLALVGEGRESEAVLPLSKLDAMLENAGGDGGRSVTNNIGNVYISKEVDGERLLRRMAGDQEAISKGLTPPRLRSAT